MAIETCWLRMEAEAIVVDEVHSTRLMIKTIQRNRNG